MRQAFAAGPTQITATASREQVAARTGQLYVSQSRPNPSRRYEKEQSPARKTFLVVVATVVPLPTPR